jgi:hypothetical protein
MTGWGNEIEKRVDPIIPEAGITLNARFFCKNIIILAFKVTNNFLESDTGVSGVHKASNA